MIPYARLAFFILARDSLFVTLAAATLMLAFSFEPPLAVKIGATVALIFSVVLLVRSYFLTDERLLRSETWRALKPWQRPTGAHGPSAARAQLQVLLLRFAKGASAVAGVMYGSALLMALAAQSSPSMPS
jgi:hypothetical protein